MTGLVWIYDQAKVREDEEVLLCCRVNGQLCVVMARHHSFAKAGERKSLRRWKNWQVTWDGAELPDYMEPVGFARINPPDRVRT